ncbi:helix-turn-helix domain-containing protein [Maribacter arenosus]|uniref:Helix-turn-helix transcriptional regulator n=1 Tax=Maribacter arenosus TaxID=1854708 RepID=A0ABR7VII6_9FLAO|nr:helix-turn-helix transcriptional regulator [Maribacter arenosus]MBD0851957.1 helix-turn-helix transcriptional regulator [Maribacter arenosus]
MTIIGNTISETRKLKGLTQEELAELAKVNLRTIQRIENNKSAPRGKTLNLICSVLELNLEELLNKEKDNKRKNLGVMVIHGIFLLVYNFALMGTFGFLTLVSEANLNSRFGAILLSVFFSLFIVWKTKKMNGIERMLKFGFGLIVFFIVVPVKHGFQTGIHTGLFICAAISLSILFYGNELIKEKE